MRKRYLIILTAFSLALAWLTIIACSAQADEYDFSRVKKENEAQVILPLETAIEEAIKNNAMLEAARAEETAREARILPSGALEDPSIEAQLTNYPISSFSARQSGMTGNEVMLVQKFPFPGKRDRLKEIAVNEFESSSREIERTKLNLIRLVKVSYYDLFLTYRRKELIYDQMNLLQGIQTIARNKYSLGTTSQSDVLELQVKSATFLIKLEEEEKNISATRAELNHLLGRRDHLSKWKPENLKESKVDLDSFISTFDEETTLSQNPKINSLKSLVKAANSKAAYTDLNTYPDFEMGVGYMQRFSNQDDNGGDFVSARVSIDLPIFQRTIRNEEQRGAKAEKMKMEALLRESTIELSHNLHATIAELKEAANKISIYRKALLPLADASILSARKAYETNETTYLTVLNLINSRFEAENDYYSALIQHESAIATLEALTGAPIPSLATKKGN